MMLLTPLHLGPDAENSCIDKQSYHEGLETAYDFITNGKQDPQSSSFLSRCAYRIINTRDSPLSKRNFKQLKNNYTSILLRLIKATEIIYW